MVASPPFSHDPNTIGRKTRAMARPRRKKNPHHHEFDGRRTSSTTAMQSPPPEDAHGPPHREAAVDDDGRHPHGRTTPTVAAIPGGTAIPRINPTRGLRTCRALGKSVRGERVSIPWFYDTLRLPLPGRDGKNVRGGPCLSTW